MCGLCDILYTIVSNSVRKIFCCCLFVWLCRPRLKKNQNQMIFNDSFAHDVRQDVLPDFIMYYYCCTHWLFQLKRFWRTFSVLGFRSINFINIKHIQWNWIEVHWWIIFYRLPSTKYSLLRLLNGNLLLFLIIIIIKYKLELHLKSKFLRLKYHERFWSTPAADKNSEFKTKQWSSPYLSFFCLYLVVILCRRCCPLTVIMMRLTMMYLLLVLWSIRLLLLPVCQFDVFDVNENYLSSVIHYSLMYWNCYYWYGQDC